MKTHMLLFVAALSLSFATNSLGQSGGDLFKANCGACHTVGKGKLVGPDLIGVENRHAEPWLLKWVKSSQTLIKSGDTTAVRLFKENNGMPMTDQSLSKEEILAVLAFIKDKSNPSTAPAPDKTVAATAAVTPAAGAENTTLKESRSILNVFSLSEYVLLTIIVVLGIVIWVLSSTIKVLASDQE
jgi:mono/diheme cytochrome c family protein